MEAPHARQLSKVCCGAQVHFHNTLMETYSPTITACTNISCQPKR